MKNNEIVNKKTAKYLKILGFKDKCRYYYEHDNNLIKEFLSNIYESSFKEYSNLEVFKNEIVVPTIYQAHQFILNECELLITVFSSSQESWMYRITHKNEKLINGVYDEDFKDYSEAMLHGIIKAIELIILKMVDFLQNLYDDNIEKSIVKGFDWFLPCPEDEYDENNPCEQCQGTHLTNEELIELALTENYE